MSTIPFIENRPNKSSYNYIINIFEKMAFFHIETVNLYTLSTGYFVIIISRIYLSQLSCKSLILYFLINM